MPFDAPSEVWGGAAQNSPAIHQIHGLPIGRDRTLPVRSFLLLWNEKLFLPMFGWQSVWLRYNRGTIWAGMF
jgi:hypothetical protein